MQLHDLPVIGAMATILNGAGQLCLTDELNI